MSTPLAQLRAELEQAERAFDMAQWAEHANAPHAAAAFIGDAVRQLRVTSAKLAVFTIRLVEATR